MADPMNRARNEPWVSPHDEWLKAHPEEVERYRGKYVAVHPTLGIVCAAPTFAELFYATFPAFDAIRDELCIDFIGDGHAPVGLATPAPRDRARCSAHRAPDIGCRGGPTCTPSRLARIWTRRYEPPQAPPLSALEIRLRWMTLEETTSEVSRG